MDMLGVRNSIFTASLKSLTCLLKNTLLSGIFGGIHVQESVSHYSGWNGDLLYLYGLEGISFLRRWEYESGNDLS